MNNSRAMKVTGLRAIALIFAGCGASEAPVAEDKGNFKGKGKGGGPVPVITAAARLKDVLIEIQVVGNVEAYSTVSVRAQVSGQLTNMLLKDGDFVKKGDPLFTIDSRQIDGQLAQAEANLARDSAQETYSRSVADRSAELVQSGTMSKDQGQQTKANADAPGRASACIPARGRQQ